MRTTLVAVTAFAALLLNAPREHLGAQDVSHPSTKLVDVIDTLCCSGIAEPASGRFLVYSDRDGIHIFDQRTRKVTATIDHTTAPVVGTYIHGTLTIAASGRRLAFLAAGEPRDVAYVWTVDLDTLTGKPLRAPHRVSTLPSSGAGISDDGRWIAFVTRDAPEPGMPPRSRLVTMPSDGGDERVLDSAANIAMPRWSPDGKTIYYIRGRGHGPGLARISAAGGAPDSLTPAWNLIGVSPDGQRIAFYPYNGDNRVIVRFADAQGRVIGTTMGGIDDWYMLWSRHEPSALIGRRGAWPTDVKTLSLADGGVSTYPLDDHWASGVRFAPDGRRLAATSMIDERLQIIVYDPASNNRRVIRTAAEPLNWAPDGPSMQWSPDGSHIAFLALDSSFTRHEIHAVDVATQRAIRLADLGPARWSNATLFRWHSDGQSIDYISGVTGHGGAPTLERVTLTGKHSVISRLPAAAQGNATDGGYRLVNDTLIAIGHNPRTETDSGYLALIDARTGQTRTVIDRGALWQLSDNSSILSPDGKWIAFATRGGKDEGVYSQWAIVSIDGKTVRMLGEPLVTPCRKGNYFGAVFPHEWLPDSRSLIGIAAGCDDRHAQVYIVPIDGSPVRHLAVPTDWDPDVTLMPDGRRLLVPTITRGSMSIRAVDFSKALGRDALQAGKPRKSSQN